MALEAGGYAAKLGDRYEGRWVVRQLLLLLNERLRSVTVEAVGDDEAGVDIWIERLDGKREAQQCKAENGTKKEWTFADLKRRGVLDYAKRQLDRDSAHSFTFVSSVPATSLRDLSRSASDSLGTAEGFYRDQIEGRSREARTSFCDFCHRLDLDSENDDDRASAYDLLRRMSFHLFSDDRESREELCYWAQVAAEGLPDHIVNALADFAESNPRRCITTPDLWNELTRLELPPRRLTADSRVAVRVGELNEEFRQSIEPSLAAGRLIPRSESEALLSLIDKDRPAEAVILHGGAGRGKSGVLYEFTQKLTANNIPFLAIRLDRKSLRGSARQFGVDLSLRESPAKCLHELAAGGRCVLILDQLDALRWTSSHAAEGLDVCKEMLREVLSLRALGSQVTAVLCCRTFDLDHDPQIQFWLKPNQQHPIERVPVDLLPESVVQDVVRALDMDYERFSPRQKELLTTVNNLAIWAKVVESDERSPDFSSQTQLLRAYWRNRRQLLEQAGIPTADRDVLLNRLVDHMERTATPSAPARFLDQYERLATELQSLGIVRVSGRTVSFAHQTHLDFLIADRVLEDLTSEPGAILAWLGDRCRMSLLRREQLRQVLLLLMDEEPQRFIETVRVVLAAPDVRFHLKQLTLEVLGQIVPNDDVFDLVMELHGAHEWHEHVEGEIFAGNPEYVRLLASRGVLRGWLESKNELKQLAVIWLLSRNCEECEEVVVQLCSQTLLLGGEWPRRVESILGRDLALESDEMFALRLQCAGAGASPMYVNWQELSDKAPERALRLFGAILEGEHALKCSESVRTSGYGRHEDPSLRALESAAKKTPLLATKLLWPLFAKYVRRMHREVRRRVREGGSRYISPYDENRSPSSLGRTLRVALWSLAELHPERFFSLAEKIEKLPGRVARRILVDGHSHLPTVFADRAVRWMLTDERRLSCGSRRAEPRWMPALRLIRRMSPRCSEDVFKYLEYALLRFIDPEELRHSKFYLPDVRRGYYSNSIGGAQYHLLPALHPSRRSAETTGRIGVLKRKFDPLGRDFFVRERSRGGFVRSPLNHSRIDNISDKAWLKLLSNRRVPIRGEERKLRYLKNRSVEVSVEQFAQDLGIAAINNPERFACLVLNAPNTIPPAYISAVLAAIRKINPPSDVPEDKRPTWVPASPLTVEALLHRTLSLDDTELAKQFCWVIFDRPDIVISDRLIDCLCYCSRHQDPHEDQLFFRRDVSASECDVHELDGSAINCVRGVAARAISRILYDHPEILPRFRSEIEALLDDPHPVVRVAAVAICLPVWNVDKSLSVEWFTRAASSDPRVAACRDARHLYNYAMPQFREQIEPIIDAMTRSPRDDVATAGASEMAARWAFYDLFECRLNECLHGTPAQRKGVAEALMHIAHQHEYSKKCLPVLLRFADDEDVEVRQKVNFLLHYDGVVRVDGFERFLLSYVSTRAFKDDPSHLIKAIQDHKGALSGLSDIILTVSNAFLIAWTSAEQLSARHGRAAAHYLVPLTLRLYEQAVAEDATVVRDRCLDFWDEMLRQRISSGAELAKGLS